MKINFFEREVNKAQQRFNQCFGAQTVSNLEERQAVIMAICWLGALNMRIKNNSGTAELVQEFIRERNILNKYFNHKERRSTNVEHTIRRETGENPKVIRNRTCQSQG